MERPDDVDLPFFAYGLFRRGQLGFLRLKPFVTKVQSATVQATLRIRDGLPIADRADPGKLDGELLFFDPRKAVEAYRAILQIEPDNQYSWGTTEPPIPKANILWGKSPKKGSVIPDEPTWDGRDDPLFTTALDVVEEIRSANQDFNWSLTPLFRLQAAYLLLWSAIERYVSLRYHLGSNVVEKVDHLADEPAFHRALSKHVLESRAVFRADQPRQRINLEPADPISSLKYYYQIRSNITHRGKAVGSDDHDRIYKSLSELLPIFRSVIQQAFEEAQA